ncbi:MAG: hypothetical protein ABL857_02740, partial [Rickettsiales bacterium]
MNGNSGFGGPTAIFYGLIPYYIGSLFQFLSAFDPNGLGRALLTMQVSIFIAGITSYHWLKIYVPKKQAEKGALIYAAFPYSIY